jgi:hypothetical protein
MSDVAKSSATVKKPGTIVLDKGTYYFESAEIAPRRKQRVAFGPLVDQAMLKNLVGKHAVAIIAYNVADMKSGLVAVSIDAGTYGCYLSICYVAPVLKKYLDQLPVDTILGFDIGSKEHFIDSLAAMKAIPVETAAEMKEAIHAQRSV